MWSRAALASVVCVLLLEKQAALVSRFYQPTIQPAELLQCCTHACFTIELQRLTYLDSTLLLLLPL
jgi:hypothetical protein